MSEKVEKEQVGYVIPAELARRIRVRAAETGRRPAHIVTEACEAYFAEAKGRRPVAAGA